MVGPSAHHELPVCALCPRSAAHTRVRCPRFRREGRLQTVPSAPRSPVPSPPLLRLSAATTSAATARAPAPSPRFDARSAAVRATVTASWSLHALARGGVRTCAPPSAELALARPSPLHPPGAQPDDLLLGTVARACPLPGARVHDSIGGRGAFRGELGAQPTPVRTETDHRAFWATLRAQSTDSRPANARLRAFCGNHRAESPGPRAFCRNGRAKSPASRAALGGRPRKKPEAPSFSAQWPRKKPGGSRFYAGLRCKKRD
jgi:hypothetical protein